MGHRVQLLALQVKGRATVCSVQSFRNDIQGLRALAVTAVVLYHAGFGVEGGYLGVDIFFVISGYLILGMVWSEFESSGSFRITKFFSRRFFRLAPALGLMVVVTVAAVLLVSLPVQEYTAETLRTGLGALFLIANVVIADISGSYFGRAPETNPLLHTWSLSVEEQFYLVFPILFWLLIRKFGRLISKRRLTLVFFILALVSFMSQFVPGVFDLSFGQFLFGFYSPLTRAWEFLAGGLVFLSSRNAHHNSVTWLTRYTGLGVVVAALAGLIGHDIAERTAVVVGAALLVKAHQNPHGIKLVLENPAVIYLGTLSYSLYLWHWPALFVANLLWPSSIFATTAGLFVALLASLLSFHFVEKPLRKVPEGLKSGAMRAILIVSVPLAPILFISINPQALTSAPLSLGTWVVEHPGDTGQGAFHEAYEQSFHPCSVGAMHKNAERFGPLVRCHQTSAVGNPTVVLIGDSHAEHLFLGLAKFAKEDVLVHYTHGNFLVAPESPEIGTILQEVSNNAEVTTVIVSAYWGLNGVPQNFLIEEMKQLLSKGKRVVITDGIPSFANAPDRCKYRLRFGDHDPNWCLSSVTFHSETLEAASRVAQLVEAVPGLELLLTHHEFCNEISCSMIAQNGDLLFRDTHHLNLNGSPFLAEKIVSQMPDLLR